MATTKKRSPGPKTRTRRKNSDILAVARKNFGFEALRPGQEDAIRALLAGKDTLVVQPTGSGKSAIYQIAALMTEGATLVISPLIALQKDQVDSINAQDAADAVVINSTQRVSETREAMEKIEEGSGKYIFLAPAFRSSLWTKHTASANGVTTSAPITSSSDRPSSASATPSSLP